MSSSAPETSSVGSVACPLCDAAPGARCHSKSGAPVEFHVARVKAAEAAHDEEHGTGLPVPQPSTRTATSTATRTATRTATSTAKPPQKKVDGVELARLRRLARAGFDADRCDLLGIRLDVGPRANRWHLPRRFDDQVVSELAAAIVESGAPPEALELAAAHLADRSTQ